jgi:17beta-estradiol 17-dehydrogenase / 3beta-hydroxysteroid 3-dehydrogenase
MPTVLTRWKSSVALVTGASAGIGAACVRALHAQGLKVAFCARRGDRLAALEEELGERAAGFVTDLRDEDSILRMFKQIRERWGGVDVLVNNAGLGHAAPLASGSTEQWREMLEVNVLALCVCTREALSDMKRRAVAGQVVHISSMASHRVPPGSGVYSATKFAVRSLTEGLRAELRAEGSDVRVAAISPGYVETEFAANYHRSGEAAAATYGRYPCLQSEDVAEALLYLLGQPAHVQVHDVLMRPTRQPG